MDTETRDYAGGAGTSVLDPPAPDAAAPAAVIPAPLAPPAPPPPYTPAPAEGARPVERPQVVPNRQPDGVIPALAALILVLLAVAGVLWLIGWLGEVSAANAAARRGVGVTITSLLSIPWQQADTTQVTLQMDTGKLEVTDGAQGVLDARVTSNVANWAPQFDYGIHSITNDVHHTVGSLGVRQPNSRAVPVGDIRYAWDLRLKPGLPLALTAELGAVDSSLQLGGLDLTRLDVNTGAGATVIDLRGNWTHDIPIRIQGGAGPVRLIVPPTTGARVTATQGAGRVQAPGWLVRGDTYTNTHYGQGPTLQIAATLGAGDLTLEQGP